MNFIPLDIKTWSRGQVFYYFNQIAPTGYSITVNLDVTKLRFVLKQEEKKFFPAYIWLVTKILNRQIEFKVAEKDGQLGYYDSLTPLYPTLHEDDKTISFMWTEFNEDFSVFYKSYLEIQKLYRNNHGMLSQTKEMPPKNSYTVSCVPWVSFSHFSIQRYDNKPYYFPTVESGAFYEENGLVQMPLSITCHHATTDGYHVNLFLEQLQYEMNHSENWLK